MAEDGTLRSKLGAGAAACKALRLTGCGVEIHHVGGEGIQFHHLQATSLDQDVRESPSFTV